MGFRGTFEHSFDDKGRISIPSAFREEIRENGGDRVVVTRFFVDEARCLDVYPYARWTKLEESFDAQERFDPKVSRLRRFYFSHAHDCTLDKQGRINVPPKLRDYANLSKEALFVSDMAKFQVWDPATWGAIDGDDFTVLSGNPESMAGLGI